MRHRAAELEGDVRRAKQALVERVAFFGITDRWAESIALFHAMTGTHPSGETLRVELGDNRRTPKNGFESKKGPDSSGAGAGVTAGRYDEAALEGFVDEADEDLFAFALRLFEQLGFREHKRLAAFKQVELRMPLTAEVHARLRDACAALGATELTLGVASSQ